jgi:clan AA aspartic protease
LTYFCSKFTKKMGLTYANVELLNAGDIENTRRHIIGEDEIRSISVTCLVDTGAITMVINESIQHALGLSTIGERISQLADGRRVKLPVAGPIEIRYLDRFCTTNALVMPDDTEVLLGAIPLEEMDLWIHPAKNLLTPVHPEGPVMILKDVK